MVWSLLVLVYFWSITIVVTSNDNAGACFRRITSQGKCTGLLYNKNLSVTECCNDRGGKYYTLQNDSFGDLFRDEISKNGTNNCFSCSNRTKILPKGNVECSANNCTAGKKCIKIMYKQKSHCIDCSCGNIISGVFKNRYDPRIFADQVCGSNGMQYSNLCALIRYRCSTNTYITVTNCSKVAVKQNSGYKAVLTAHEIHKLKDKSIKVLQLVHLIQGIGLNVTLQSPPKKDKTVAVYPIICQIMKMVGQISYDDCP